MVAAWPLAATDARAERPCPSETYFQGIACVHARETCGGWDGTSCAPGSGPVPREQSTRDEYARIDRDAKAICTEDATAAYQGSVSEVKKVVDDAVAAASGIEDRLRRLRDAAPTPQWRTVTHARAGNLYDCIWQRVLRASPTLFTPRQQQMLQRLQAIIASQVPAAAVQTQIAALTVQVPVGWIETQDQYLRVLAERMVIGYVTAAVLARRYALEGFALTQAASRLPVVAAAVGDYTMTNIVGGIRDPTDPGDAGRAPRRLVYVPGVFASF